MTVAWEERKAPLGDIPEPSSVQPPGVYLVRIEGIEPLETRTGKFMIRTVFRIEEPESSKGQMLFERYTIGTEDDPEAVDPETWTGKATVGCKLFGAMLKAAQVPVKTSLKKACDKAVGQPLLTTVTLEVQSDRNADGSANEYAGRQQNRLTRYAKVGTAVPEVRTGTVANPRDAVSKPKVTAPKPPVSEDDDEDETPRRPTKPKAPALDEDD